MAKKIYLNVDPAGYKLEKAISEHTGEANQVIVTNEDGYIDSSLINVQLPELPEQDPNHYSEGEHQGLTFKVNGGKYTLNNNTVVESNSRSFDLPKNTKSCIYVEISTGQILTARSFPSNCYKLYEVQTYNDSFIVEKDYREKINLTQLIDDDDANSENKTYSASKINEMFNAGGSGHVIQENYTSIANRPNLNFVGNNIAVVDDLDNYATTVQVSSIVETSELPTEDIREDILYNKDGVLYKHYNGEWIIISRINDEGEGDETDDGDTYTYSAKKIKNLIEDAGGSGHDIQKDETSIDPQQSKLNFVGDNISVYNNNNNESTDVKVNSIIAVSNLPVGSDIDENLIYNHNGVLKRYQNGDWITIGEIDDNSEGSINTTYSSDKINSLLENIDSSGGHTIIHNGEPVPQRDNLDFYPSVVSDNADANTTHVNLQSIIEVEELPTEEDFIDTNNFYNHNGILKHFDGENWIPIGSGATINDTEASLMSTFSSEKILNLIELSRIRAVSNWDEFKDAADYFAELNPVGGTILIVGQILIDGEKEINLYGIEVRGATSSISNPNSTIKFKTDNSKLKINDTEYNANNIHPVLFKNLLIEGTVVYPGAPDKNKSKTKFILGLNLSGIEFDNCVFKGIFGEHTISDMNPDYYINEISNAMEICTNGYADPNQILRRIDNPVFIIKTELFQSSYCNHERNRHYLSNIVFNNCEITAISTIGFNYGPLSGISIHTELSGIPFYSHVGYNNTIYFANIRNNFSVIVNNLKVDNVNNAINISKIIISQHPNGEGNPRSMHYYKCYDGSVNFVSPINVPNPVENPTTTLVPIPNTPAKSVEVYNSLSANINRSISLNSNGLTNDCEIQISKKDSLISYKVTLEDLKTYFTS